MTILIRNKFKQNTGETIIQLFIGNNNVYLRQITNNTIEPDIIYCEDNISNLYYHLKSIPQSIIELIYLSDASFRNITSVNIQQTGIKNLLMDKIIKNNNCLNTSFYKIKSLNKNTISINICDVLFPSWSANIINKLISDFDNIASFVSFPEWVTTSYFKAFKLDKNKFSIGIFVVKTNRSTEIIAISKNEEIICYRKFKADNFNEKDEIIQTMEYLSHENRVPLEDISIYQIGEETLCTFIQPIKYHTKFVSSIITEKNFIFEEYNSIIRIALRAFCCGLSILLLYNIYSIGILSDKISKENTIISSVPNYIISEIDVWRKIPADIMHHIDYKAIISDILSQTGDIKILSLNINRDKAIISVKMKMFTPDLITPYSKEIITNNYKFEVNVSHEEIICNGTRC